MNKEKYLQETGVGPAILQYSLVGHTSIGYFSGDLAEILVLAQYDSNQELQYCSPDPDFSF